jgi:hypothetical protein
MEHNDSLDAEDDDDDDLIAVLVVFLFVVILILPFILFVHPSVGFEILLMLVFLVTMLIEPMIMLSPAEIRFLFCGIINNCKLI